MKTWVKICGNTNLEDCLAALSFGADALGFIFDESPRQVTPQDAARMVAHLPPGTESYGVFVNEPVERLVETVRGARLTGVQLHGDESPDYVKCVLRQLEGVKVIKTIPAEFGQYQGLGTFSGGENLVDFILVDSGTVILRGGTGLPFNWLRAADFIMGLEKTCKVIIAGGLSTDNVAAAVSFFHPYGVDVVTGVEKEKGKKDHDKLREFINAVHYAKA